MNDNKEEEEEEQQQQQQPYRKRPKYHRTEENNRIIMGDSTSLVVPRRPPSPSSFVYNSQEGEDHIERNHGDSSLHGPYNRRRKTTAQPRPILHVPAGGGGGGIHMRPIMEPNPNDVLCGRGGRINAHAGNIQFRTIIQEHKNEYLAKTVKKLEKAYIAAKIVHRIRTMNPPGRFLKQDDDTGLWFEIGDAKAIKKTGQALREDAPDLRPEIENGPGGDKEVPESTRDHADGEPSETPSDDQATKTPKKKSIKSKGTKNQQATTSTPELKHTAVQGDPSPSPNRQQSNPAISRQGFVPGLVGSHPISSWTGNNNVDRAHPFTQQQWNAYGVPGQQGIESSRAIPMQSAYPSSLYAMPHQFSNARFPTQSVASMASPMPRSYYQPSRSPLLNESGSTTGDSTYYRMPLPLPPSSTVGPVAASNIAAAAGGGGGNYYARVPESRSSSLIPNTTPNTVGSRTNAAGLPIMEQGFRQSILASEKSASAFLDILAMLDAQFPSPNRE